jgi:hypothetical protein
MSTFSLIIKDNAWQVLEDEKVLCPWSPLPIEREWLNQFLISHFKVRAFYDDLPLHSDFPNVEAMVWCVEENESYRKPRPAPRPEPRRGVSKASKVEGLLISLTDLGL